MYWLPRIVECLPSTYFVPVLRTHPTLCEAGPRQTASQVRAVWHNMREEPNVYINGRPYVLREDERPYKNLQEYSGIDYQRLQRMEARGRPACGCAYPAHALVVAVTTDNARGRPRMGCRSASGPADALEW